MDPRLVERAADLSGVAPDRVVVRALDYDAGSPATGGLWCVGAGETTYFTKLLRHPRLWPHLSLLPEPARHDFLTLFPWRFELDMALSPIASLLPEGLRAARLEHHEVLDDDHVLTWWEWIEQRPETWSDADYARAAYALGRLAARRAAGTEAATTTEIVPGLGACGSLRYLFDNRVRTYDTGLLTDPGFWAHPVVASALRDVDDPRLPDDLAHGVHTAPEVFDRLIALPLTLAHGDASIQNLLITPDDDLVVIDWGFGGLLPVGFDLGQLLVGGAHAGLVDPEALPALHEVIVVAYLDGLAAEGHPATRDDVLLGHLGGLWVRSAFTALPYDALDGDPDDGAARMRERLRLSRALLDLAGPVVGFEPARPPG